MSIDDQVANWLVFGGKSPLPLWPDIAKSDTVLVIDRTTGCHFVGSKLIHTEQCMCGEY